jgi:NDP-sugar pyrophosphorylase family protein
VDVVVMAAGEGRRLRPLTERWAKPVLPIDGRPVIATLLRELRAAGSTAATIVVGHLGTQIESLVDDGVAFGLRIAYAHQPERLGSADAVRCAVAAGARPPLVAVGADTVFQPGSIAAARERWLASGTLGGLAVRDVPVREIPERSSVQVEGDRLVSVVEKPPNASAGTLAGAPLWFLGDELCASLDELEGPPYELAAAAQRALASGGELAAIRIGPTRDITRPHDVLARNFPYLVGLDAE